ncbi:MAG: DUF4097 family beta strand repeat protein [Opitutaceae bacterium]|nr:DUF4097 family beta strand repeat protein [Opitutaceae bacterium]
MNTHRLPVSLLIATAFTLVLVVAARAADEPTTIKFTDPAKPGRLEVKLGQGDLRIVATDGAEVAVTSEAKAVTKTPRKDGLRVISSSSSYVLSEKDNVVTLDAMSDGRKGGGTFHLTVPRSTAVVVQNSWGGDITCTGLAGNLELNCMNGTIRLEEIAGGVVASTMNGEIRASFRELREGSPVSFTSMNGEVVLRLPADAKASVRLRTQNGSVLTDFDEAALVTKSETSPVNPRGRTMSARRPNIVISDDVHESIREAVREAATVAQEAVAAVKEGFGAAREGVEAARREASERARRDAERERNRTSRPAEAPAAPAAAKPPTAPTPPKMPSIPTISGGKLVTGTLNGGGPEISVATMNGDVTLRKLSTGK